MLLVEPADRLGSYSCFEGDKASALPAMHPSLGPYESGLWKNRTRVQGTSRVQDRQR